MSVDRVAHELGIDHEMSIVTTPCAPTSSQKEFWEMEKMLSNNLKDKILHMATQRCFGDINVYNPLTYASVPHRDYLMKYCGPKDLLFVGMNPGRNGMGQNGIPFGDPEHVWNWLNITGAVTVVVPPNQNKEESGHRFWGLMKDIWKSPQWFSQNCFVYNYCPLLFLGNGGNNIPLKEILANNLRCMELDCDWALRVCIRIIKPKIIVGVGGYAERRIKHVLEQDGSNIRYAKICHPAIRGMKAEDWKRHAHDQLRDILRDFVNI